MNKISHLIVLQPVNDSELMCQIVRVIQALQYCIFLTLIRPILGEPHVCDVCYSKNFNIPTVAIFMVVSYGTWNTFVLIGAKG